MPGLKNKNFENITQIKLFIVFFLKATPPTPSVA